MSTQTDNNKKSRDLIVRGNYSPSPISSSIIFVGLRAFDGFIFQRALQVLNPIPLLCARLGLSIPPPPPTGGPPLAMSSHDLTPFQAVLWSMAIGSAVKHIAWYILISKETMDPSSAFIVGLFNLVINSLNTLAFSFASVNPTWSTKLLYASVPMYTAGIMIEFIAEWQRKQFKDDPKNQGKPYSGGLFGYARSINYFGYTMWRASFATAGGGLIWGALTMSGFCYDFTHRAIPILDEYCAKRYGAQWQEVKRKVPHAFFPGLW
ncbi:hypothetical protein H2198_010137 [Neophaeococcomyces mojaviensis]|uniref:Uncharacterized protein n=1 Tax=Neophaeococcomyces mojaviensis TaxID=3383035 RepID=A0ACC2ZSG9_9EURO|nr:hypothetical protein H2198_010137 [Knufia sp. JES_112]